MQESYTTTIQLLRAKYGARIDIADDCEISPDVVIEISETGYLKIGERVSIRRGTTIEISRRAKVIINDDVAIGEHVFIAAMIGVSIGRGCGISNMVDIHDTNHRDRSFTYLPNGDLTTYSSGFDGAPIVIETGVIISNKVSITAGVRIGQNTKIGANSVVSRSVGNNLVAVGVPAKPIRHFDAMLWKYDVRPIIRVGFFGTSIMEHLEAYAPQLFQQANLPPVGSQVVIEKWVNRGYVYRLNLALQAEYASTDIRFDNFAVGGATSRTLLHTVKTTIEDMKRRFDLVFFACGINDVWRHFQGRIAEEVDITEYEVNYGKALSMLKQCARSVISLSETPFGLPDSAEMNNVLHDYNCVANAVAARQRIDYIDLYTPFMRAAQEFAAGKGDEQNRKSLWSDGIHLSELGDAFVTRRILNYIDSHNVFSDLQTLKRLERNEALDMYSDSIE